MTGWAYRVMMAGAALGVIALFFSVRYLPSIDLAQHAAQVAALRNPAMADLLEVNWWTPYALGYVPAHALAAVVSPRLAVNLVMLAAVLAVPLVTLLLSRNPWWAFAAFPASLGFAFHWGFFSCVVATPLLLVLVWAMHEEVEASRRKWLVMGVAIALAWAHALIAGVGLVIAGAMALAARRIRAVLPLAPAALLLALWWVSDAAPAGPSVFGDPPTQRLAQLPALAGGGDPPAASFALATALFALLVLTGRPSRSLTRWAPVGVTVLAMLVLPRDVAGGGYLYPRLGVFILPLLIFALERTEGRTPAAILFPVIVFGWLSFTFHRWRTFGEETRALPALFATMEPGGLLLYLPLDATSERSAFPLHRGSGGWYAAERDGWSELSLGRVKFMIARYRPGKAPALSTDSLGNMERIGDVSAFDYVLVRGRQLDRAGLRLLRSDRPWWLYAVDATPTSLPLRR